MPHVYNKQVIIRKILWRFPIWYSTCQYNTHIIAIYMNEDIWNQNRCKKSEINQISPLFQVYSMFCIYNGKKVLPIGCNLVVRNRNSNHPQHVGVLVLVIVFLFLWVSAKQIPKPSNLKPTKKLKAGKVI